MTHLSHPPDHHLTRARSLWGAGLLSIPIWLAYVLIRLPVMQQTPTEYRILPGPITSLPFVFLLALGIATLAVLTWQNRHRLRAVFRPNPGRVLCALAMFMVAPIVLFAGFPISAGFGLIHQRSLGDALLLIPLISWYLASSLVISGIRARLLRVGIFWVLWWSCYSALVLTMGIAVFRL